VLKLLLTAAIPFQSLVDRPSPSHGFINSQALAILTADGKQKHAAWLQHYLEPFNEGCDWADTGWKNVGHMYDPETGMGFRGWPSAPQMLSEYWNLAVRYFGEQAPHQAFFYLGAAAHLVQDLCVPHHAAARLFSGHKAFEEYARRYRHLFAVRYGGLYGLARTPEGWVINNANYTRRHFSHCLTATVGRAELHEAVAELLPRAQRSTAGFVSYYLRHVGVLE